MITDITIGSLTLNSTNGYVFGNTSGFEFPEIRVDIKNRGNYDGARLGNFNYGKRAYSIEGEIWGDDPTDYESKRRALEKAVSFNSTNGVQEIQITTRGGLSLKTDAIIVTFDVPYKKHDMARGSFLLQFNSPYPFLLSQTDYSTNVSPSTGGGFAIPIAIPFDMTNGGTAATTVTNNGNIDAFPTVTIIGGIQNPSIKNNTTDEVLSYSGTLASLSDTLVIDFYNRTALLNSTNVLANISGDWFRLSPGDNSITFFGISPTASAQATIAYNYSYIGI